MKIHLFTGTMCSNNTYGHVPIDNFITKYPVHNIYLLYKAISIQAMCKCKYPQVTSGSVTNSGKQRNFKVPRSIIMYYIIV